LQGESIRIPGKDAGDDRNQRKGDGKTGKTAHRSPQLLRIAELAELLLIGIGGRGNVLACHDLGNG